MKSRPKKPDPRRAEFLLADFAEVWDDQVALVAPALVGGQRHPPITAPCPGAGSANSGVERYRSPVSQSTVTTSLP